VLDVRGSGDAIDEAPVFGEGGGMLMTLAQFRATAASRRYMRAVSILGLCALAAILSLRPAVAATIFVTTTQQKISSTGGCSLQEAIWSSRLHQSIAVSRYDLGNNYEYVGTEYVATQCAAGDGNDTIVLPAKATLPLNKPVADSSNYMGPTATPMIASNVTIEGYGATLSYVPACYAGYTGTPCSNPAFDYLFRAFSVGASGNLTLKNVRISGFVAKGGDGGYGGGGGGLGAGGAIYLQGGTLSVQNSTFDHNGAVGGNGGDKAGGDTPGGAGGGGVGGSGGSVDLYLQNGAGQYIGGGSGGGGSASFGDGGGFAEGGGGGTAFGAPYGKGAYDCGGDGASSDDFTALFGGNGGNATCPGGGGGGGGYGITTSGDGGTGAYGGGGGGGAAGGGNGGSSDFGGGGGSGWAGAFGGTNGGHGGFGGGGGAAADGYIAGGGNPGHGGHFGGHGIQRQGGGGGGLGGAIFNDSGTLVVKNSTFYDNYAAHGFGGGYPSASRAADGGDGGGAIFSRNGSTTILNSTIAANQGTGQGSGVVVYEDGQATSFLLQNTIIANNTDVNTCLWTGNVSHSGVGNLIMNNGSGTQPFGACDDPRVTADPQLGPLQDNGGPTYTMAIPLFSSAMSTADPTTSLSYDQRYADRPQVGGYDIGAYEICRRFIVGLRLAPCSETNIPPPSTVTLTMQAAPANGGTTTPAPGSNEEQVNSVVPVVASPAYGYLFGGWSSNVTNPASPATTVIMDDSKTVTATFTYCGCALDVSNAVNVTRGGYVLNLVTGRYVQTVTLTNTSAATITGPLSLVLDGLSSYATLYNPAGTTDSLEPPSGSAYANVTNNNLLPGATVSVQLQFVDPTRTTPISYVTRVLAGPGMR
jgi:hypothetical protein